MSTVGSWQGPGIIKDNSLVVYIDPSSPNCYYLQSGSVVNNMGDQTYRSYTVSYYTGSLSSASFNTIDKTFDHRFKLEGGGGSRVTTDFTIQQTIFYPTGSPNTIDYSFTTQVGSGTGIGMGLGNAASSSFLVLAGGTRLVLSNIPRNQWFNLTYTKEGSSLKGYVNGILINTGSWSTFTIYDNMFLGSSGGSLALTNYYIRAANLLVYNRALTPTEIMQNKTVLGARVGI